MNIKLRTLNNAGSAKIEYTVDVKEIMINEDFLHPNHESIAIAFRNRDTSGIIEFKSSEFDKFVSSVKKKIHLVKNVKAFGSEGAINLEGAR